MVSERSELAVGNRGMVNEQELIPVYSDSESDKEIKEEKPLTEEQKVKKKEVSAKVAEHMSKMRDASLKKRQERAKIKQDLTNKELFIKKEKEKEKSERVNKEYEETVEKPKKVVSHVDKPEPVHFKDLLDVKTYYKNKYKKKYSPHVIQEESKPEPQIDHNELMRRAMNSVRFC
jgi:hypothetical protein